MEATTTRASTVIRSMPTREIRTQASITIPLSNTRSSTSIRLEPPETRSTAIEHPPAERRPAELSLVQRELANISATQKVVITSLRGTCFPVARKENRSLGQAQGRLLASLVMTISQFGLTIPKTC